MPRIHAVIDPASPGYSGWCRYLGRDFVPLMSAEPEPVLFEGEEVPSLTYRVDLEALAPGVLDRIVEDTARASGESTREVARHFLRDGLRVNVGEVIVCEDPNEGRLRFPFWTGKGVGS